MPSSHESLLCQYRYDALDRLIGHAPVNEAQHQRFYCKSRLATEIQGALRHSIVQHGDLLLAQQQRSGDATETTLLATDQQRSVLYILKEIQPPLPITYIPYGHCHPKNGLASLLGFNGERPDPVTGHYLLGNGYRAFNPVLMRFNSPDNLSPFGKGGLNSYAYCLGDPINLQDSTGAAALPKLLSRAFEGILKSLGRTGHTYRKGSAKLFSSVTTTTTSKSNTFTYSDSPYMGRRHSAPSDSAKAPSPEEFAKWDLIGNHGTSKHNTDRLIAGLDPSFIGSKNGLFRGRGFYTTPDYDRAMGYASNAIQPHPPQVFGVYVKNFSSLKPGIDYTFHTHSHRRNNLEVVLREPAYSSVQIRAIDKQRKVVLPRPNEAPF